MLKQRMWLAVVGLAAGAILAYLQTHKSAPAPAPKLPSAAAVNSAPGGRPQRLPTAEPPPPQAALTPAPAPAPLAIPPERPVTPRPTLARSFTPVTSYSSETWPDFFVADSPVWATPLVPDDGKLWTKTIYLEGNPSSAGGKLSFINKKADGDPLSRLTFTNMSDVGTEYPLIKSGDTTFLGRVAGGLSRDYTGLAEGQRIPEVLFGCQFEHQITQRHKILGAVEYAHDVTDFGRRRIRTLAAWEVLLDPDKNVSLRTGILESSNKAPTGEQAMNLNYTVDLIWKF